MFFVVGGHTLKIPTDEQMNIVTNSVNADAIVVQTTSCPASSASLPISAAIGTDETAIGVPYRAMSAGNSSERNPALYAASRHTAGHSTTRTNVPVIICFFNLPTALN